VKSRFFLRLPVSWAAGDSSTGSLFGQNGKKSGLTKALFSHFPWLLLPSGGIFILLVILLVKAEERQNWLAAQASLITILVLLAVTLLYWWHANCPGLEPSVAAVTYHGALRKLLWCVAIGIVAMVSNATRTEYWAQGIVARAIGYGILIAGFSFMFGVLLGYLFGLRPTDNSQKAAGQSPSTSPQTNLVEIADWLTKIILGAGLVQLTSLPKPIWTFATNMAAGVVNGTNEPANPAIALAIMGFFATCGLLYGYLWTRYEDAVTSYGAGDTSAAALVNRWLNGHPTPDDQTRLDMIEAVKHASSTARMRIYLQAEQYRKSSTEDINERSLPVFQALVDADSEGVFHRNRGQFALALMGRKKDPNRPGEDWSNALALLNDAIRIRDLSEEPGWHEYEFARAVCQIKLDQNLIKRQPSDPQLAQSIRADLDQAKDIPNATQGLIDKDQVVNQWMTLNPKKTP